VFDVLELYTETMLYIIYAIIVLSLVSILYLCAKALGLFGTREKPEHIIGTKVRLGEVDGLGPTPPKLPYAVVSNYSDDKYRLDFIEPFSFEGKLEKYALVSARHVGYPVSRLSKRSPLAVNGVLESGKGFVALITSV
jgi:hypothetical protein